MTNENKIQFVFTKNLNHFLSVKNIQQNELAKFIGVTGTTVNNWVKGYKMPRMDKIDKICLFLNINRSALLEENIDNMRSSGVRIPILGRVAAGVPIDAIQNIEGYIDIPESWAIKGEHFGLRVKGHSMEPRIMEGDLAIIRRQENVENGKIALVQINGNTEATIKKIRYQDNGIILTALNEAVYSPHFYSKEDIEKLPVIVVGQVVHVWHDLE